MDKLFPQLQVLLLLFLITISHAKNNDEKEFVASHEWQEIKSGELLEHI